MNEGIIKKSVIERFTHAYFHSWWVPMLVLVVLFSAIVIPSLVERKWGLEDNLIMDIVIFVSIAVAGVLFFGNILLMLVIGALQLWRRMFVPGLINLLLSSYLIMRFLRFDWFV